MSPCELCGASLDADHAHLADVGRRSLACVCRACALLFGRPGAAGGQWRTVPDRHRADPSFVLSEGEWEALGIPVSMAFFLKNSTAGRWTAVYPSPAGPVESALRLEAWAAMALRTRLADVLEPDVEALLFTARDGGGYGGLLVPIHVCYALVGEVRKSWRGLDGGEDARRVIATRLASLRARCEESLGGAR